MPVIITSKQDKFRRCGMAHPKAATVYRDDKFSKKELAILQGEAMLTVEIVADPEAEKAAAEKAAAEKAAVKKAAAVQTTGDKSDQSNPTDQTDKSSAQDAKDDKGGAQAAAKAPAKAKTKPPVHLAAVAKPAAKK